MVTSYGCCPCKKPTFRCEQHQFHNNCPSGSTLRQLNASHSFSSTIWTPSFPFVCVSWVYVYIHASPILSWLPSSLSAFVVPRARIQKGLQDVKVHAGEDATFSVQLSASQSGCWFFNGKRLEEEEGEEGQQYQITHSGLDHALRIKGVQLAANGSEVQFEANGVKECAALCVQGEALVGSR